MLDRSRSLVPLALLLAACPKSEGSTATEPEVSSSSSSSSSSGSSSSGDGPTTLEPTTGEPTTGSPGTDTSTGSGTSTGELSSTGSDSSAGVDSTGASSTGEEVCEPTGDEGVQISWNLEIEGVPASESLSAQCKIIGSKPDGMLTSVSLDCELPVGPTSVILRYLLAPEGDIPWKVGAMTALDYRHEQPFWINAWMTVSNGDGISLHAVRASSIAPPGMTTFEFYGREFDVQEACEPVEDRCGQLQGLQLAFPLPEEPLVSVYIKPGEFAGNLFFIPQVNVWVQKAHEHLAPNNCDDEPDQWFDALFTTDCSNC